MVAPDFSAAQRRVINNPHVTLVGVDARGRPVVSGKSGIPEREMTWALKRDGDPIEVTEPIEKR